METRVSPMEEQKLTRAIEKAATIADVNDSLNRDELLANSLIKEGVDKKFAKVASAAFNKRITVLTFKKTADEHRAEAFPLTDADNVYCLMGGEKAQQKTASVIDSAFEISFNDLSKHMNKAASAKTVSRPLYEDTITCEIFKNKLESMIDKQAAAFSELSGKYESLDSDITTETAKLADYFQKSACSSYEFTTLVNAYGKDFEDAFKDVLPKSTDFTKTASAVIVPKGYIYKRTEELLNKRAYAKELKKYIYNYSKGLSEFCKTAAAVGNGLSKIGISLGTIAGGTLRGGLLLGQLAGNTTNKLTTTMHDALSNGFNNARTMYNVGNNVGLAPGDVLDAEFLIKDRFRDRLLGWSDMAADPQFSIYPAEQVFNATQKVMDTDTALERPDKREVLRAQVAQILAQNNRQSTADVAALAQTLKAFNEGGGSGVMRAAAPVYALDKIKAEDLPELEAVSYKPEMSFSDVDTTAKSIKDGLEASKKEQKEERDRTDKKQEAEAQRKHEKEENDKDRQTSRDNNRDATNANKQRTRDLLRAYLLAARYAADKGVSISAPPADINLNISNGRTR